MKTVNNYTDIKDNLSLSEENTKQVTPIGSSIDGLGEEIEISQPSEEIPEEYLSIISQITDAVNNGFIVYFNPDTLEIEQISGEGDYEPAGIEYSEQNEDMIDEFGLNYTEWDNFIRFEPFGRDDVLSRIDIFVNRMDNPDLNSKLEKYIDRDELLERFPSILEKTDYREDWDTYKREEIESYVRSQVVGTLSRKVENDDDVYSL